MIGHEDPGMHVQPELISPLAQPVGMRFHIRISREANLAVVTPLHNMHRQPGRTQAAAARHERLLQIIAQLRRSRPSETSSLYPLITRFLL